MDRIVFITALTLTPTLAAEAAANVDLSGKLAVAQGHAVEEQSYDPENIASAEEEFVTETVSALAVLLSAQDGRKPEKALVDEATTKLRSLGFDVYPGGPIALTINAPREKFERVFRISLEFADDGQPVPKGPSATIPSELGSLIERIEFPARYETFP